MTVSDVMTADPTVCVPETTVAEAAHLMWRADCGILPVVNEGRLVGVVTDRDMFIALATRDRLASDLRVGEVASTTVWTCGPDDDVHTALETMKAHRVRRLPVIGFGSHVRGIVSMNDILLAAGKGRPVRNEEVVRTFQAICAHDHMVPHIVAA